MKGMAKALRPSYGAGLLIIRPDGKSLLVRRAPGMSMPGRWGPPGGGEEPGETPEETAFREAAEELGGLPELEHAREEEGHWHADGPYFAFATFAARLKEGQESWKPTLDRENDAWGWFGLDELPRPLLPGAAAAVRDLVRLGRPRMGVAAVKSFTVCKVVNVDEKSPSFLSLALTIYDEALGRALQMTFPFMGGEPLGLVLPACRRIDMVRVKEHYEEILAADPSLVLSCAEGMPGIEAVDFALAEIRARAKEEVAKALEEAVSMAVGRCLDG